MSTISSDDLTHYIAHAAEVGENGTPAITTGTLASICRELLSLRESHPIEDGEGWVRVPRELDENMWGAFFKARDTIFPEQMERLRAQGRGWKGLPAIVWETMLAAAPSNPGTSKVGNSRST